MEIPSIVQIAGQLFVRHSNYVFIIFAVLKNSYVIISVFLFEALTVFCGTLRFSGIQFEKH
jgi:hypothetical protein